MSTAPTDVLSSDQRDWLKSMGVALSAPVSGIKAKETTASPPTPPTPPTQSTPSTKPDAVRAETPKADPNESPNISVDGKPVVKQGSKGQDVKDLQTLLNKHGATLKVDGDFGKLTTDAVKEFQKKNPPLKDDGVVGKQTWTALAASKPEPPKPPDTKPRTVIYIVTDAATNDAVKDASVKVADQTEKTGNTGQATFSLAPGSYPFGVTADGFEQFVDTLVVTDKDEVQKRVELKAGELKAKVVLTVAPSGSSKQGDEINLVATVSVGAGKTPPPGRVEFVVHRNKSSRQPLVTLLLQNGEAKHKEKLLPAGVHLLEATYTPTPAVNGVVFAKSQPVEHKVTQDEKGEDKQVAKRIASAFDEGDKQTIVNEVESLKNRAMRRLMNVVALLEKAGKTEDLLGVIGEPSPGSDRVATAVFTIRQKFSRTDWFKPFSRLNEADRKAVLSRTPVEARTAYDLEEEPDPSDPNDEPADANAKIFIEKGVSTKATIEFHSKTFGGFGTREFEVKIGPNGRLKSVGIDMTIVKAKLEKVSVLGPVLDLEGKLSVGGESEFKDHERVIVKEVQLAVKGEVQLKFPEINGLKNVTFVLGVKFDNEAKFHFEAAIVIPIPQL